MDRVGEVIWRVGMVLGLERFGGLEERDKEGSRGNGEGSRRAQGG